MPWTLGVLWPAGGCLSVGPLAEISALSPQLYTTFSELSSGNLPNEGSQAVDWDLFGTPTLERSLPFCQALRYDVAVPDGSGTDGVVFQGSTTTTTYSVFINQSSASAGTLSAKGNSPNAFSGREHVFAITSAGALTYRMFNGGVATLFTSSTGVVPFDGNWHMVSATFQASTAVRMYVDGVEVFAQTSSIPASKNNPSVCHTWGCLSNSAVAANATPFIQSFDGLMAHGFIDQDVASAATLLGIFDAAMAASTGSVGWAL